MKITILCTNKNHPIYSVLKEWVSKNIDNHVLQLSDEVEISLEGDILFIVSSSQIISKDIRDRYKKCLVLHAGDLPKNRGWSPHIWEILRGASDITLTLLDAEDKVDSGAIYLKKNISIPKHLIWNEINCILFKEEIAMMEFFIKNYHKIKSKPQNEFLTPTYCKKRKPEDSKLDPKKNIEEQFDLIRTCDPDRYPAYFDLNGFRYKIKIEKLNS